MLEFKQRGLMQAVQVEHIRLPIDAVDTHRPRPVSPTHKRLRINSETARELSDRTATSLSLGEGDTVNLLDYIQTNK